jgi:excisionase family DNA binding protein
MLRVSRPHLVKLLDDGVIAHTKAGRHRRVMFGDVVKYMNERNAERRERLNKLIRDTEDAGLYDLEEFDLMPTR